MNTTLPLTERQEAIRHMSFHMKATAIGRAIGISANAVGRELTRIDRIFNDLTMNKQRERVNG